MWWDTGTGSFAHYFGSRARSSAAAAWSHASTRGSLQPGSLWACRVHALPRHVCCLLLDKKQGSGACAFHCHPRDAAVFSLVLEQSQPASPHFVRFVEPSLFHVLTFAVLHWRASFDGMARIWTRAASDNAAALSRLTVLVQETFLQRCCREHVCAIGAE
ncbi:unnamed protein product, partial [Symbiodinium sp. KB8]